MIIEVNFQEVKQGGKYFMGAGVGKDHSGQEVSSGF